MKLRSGFDMHCGLREVYSSLNLSSSLSGHILLDREMPVSFNKISSLYSQLSVVVSSLSNEENHKKALQAKEILLGVRDIRNTLSAIEAGKVPDDIELFEIKSLSMISESMKPLLADFANSFPDLPDLSKVVKLLDPEGLQIPSFYIYDSYDIELSQIRKELRSAGEFCEELYTKCALIEEKIRRRLGLKLMDYLKLLNTSLHNLADTDIILAKADLFIRWNLAIPEISENITRYDSLFNPEIYTLLKKEGKEYQPININLERESPVALMGANMGGKSLTLRTLALAQYMFQFGFGVPAKKAQIVLVHQISYFSGDYQDLTKGLSSFAAEMKIIDNLLKQSKDSNSILAILDEPARTTNPYEGSALVESLISLLRRKNLLSIIATHYNIDASGCVKMRVKGFEDGKMNYELICTQDGEAPKEAITIAKSLGIDEMWLEEASRIIDKRRKTI